VLIIRSKFIIQHLVSSPVGGRPVHGLRKGFCALTWLIAKITFTYVTNFWISNSQKLSSEKMYCPQQTLWTAADTTHTISRKKKMVWNVQEIRLATLSVEDFPSKNAGAHKKHPRYKSSHLPVPISWQHHGLPHTTTVNPVRSHHTSIKARLHGSPRLINTVESTKPNRVNSTFQRKWSTGLTGEQVGDAQLSFNVVDHFRWLTTDYLYQKASHDLFPSVERVERRFFL